MDFADRIAHEHNAAFIHSDPRESIVLDVVDDTATMRQIQAAGPEVGRYRWTSHRRDPQWITGLVVRTSLPDRVTAEPKVELTRSLATANLNLMACEGCSMKALRTGLIGGALLAVAMAPVFGVSAASATDTETLPPTLTSPTASSVVDGGTGIQLSYILPEAPLAESVHIFFNGQGPGCNTVDLTMSDSQSVITTIDPANIQANVNVRGATANTLPPCVYTVIVVYRDASANPSATAFATNVSIALAPGVTTSSATSIGTNSATLNGSATANYSDTQVGFSIGTDPTLTSGTTTISPATTTIAASTGTTSASLTADANLLQPATTYYYRLVADNAIGSPQLGNIVSFTTGSLATPVVPTPSAGPQLLNGSVKAKLKIKKRAQTASNNDNWADRDLALRQTEGVQSQSTHRHGQASWEVRTDGCGPRDDRRLGVHGFLPDHHQVAPSQGRSAGPTSPSLFRPHARSADLLEPSPRPLALASYRR